MGTNVVCVQLRVGEEMKQHYSFWDCAEFIFKNWTLTESRCDRIDEINPGQSLVK
jgi:hypothetical protein